jgi:hypothetical protein
MNKDQQIEAKNLLHMAQHRLESLEAEIEQLRPKAEAFDVMREFSRHMNHDHGSSAMVDPKWQINRFLDELNKPKPVSVE